MLISLIVYSVMALIFIGSCYIGSRNKDFSLVVIGIISYCLIMGIRYGVGIDYFAYFDIYKNALHGISTIDLERMEPGFISLTTTYAMIGLSPILYFLTLAFIQIFPPFLLLRKNTKIWPFLAFSFVFLLLWLNFANNIRQFMAMGFLVYSSIYIYRKEFIKFLLCIVVGSLFHSAIVVYVILYPILYKKNDIYTNSCLTFCLVILSLLLAESRIISNFIEPLEFLIDSVGYGGYINNGSEYMDVQVNKGMGFYIFLLVNLSMIIISGKVKSFYKNSIFPIFYSLFITGTIFQYIFLYNQLFSRLASYLAFFNYIVLAFSLRYLYLKKRMIFYAMICVCSILYFGTIFISKPNVGGAYFQFIWDYY